VGRKIRQGFFSKINTASVTFDTGWCFGLSDGGEYKLAVTNFKPHSPATSMIHAFAAFLAFDKQKL